MDEAWRPHLLDLIDAIGDEDLLSVALYIRMCDFSEMTPEDARNLLYMAAGPYLNETCLEMLLEAGININLANDKGETCLHYMAKMPTPYGVIILLEHGADPNECAKDGSTPLHMAALYGRVDIIKELIKYGAKDRPDINGKTAVSLLDKRSNGRAKQILALMRKNQL